MKLYEARMRELINFTKQNSIDNPYAASIYNEDGTKIISVISNEDSPVNHAEILAISGCAQLYPAIQWDKLSLYSTGEPCCMCAAACCWSNFKEVIYATDVHFMIELWGLESHIRARDIIKSYPKSPNLIEGICQHESNQLFLHFKDLFAQLWNKKHWQLTSK